METRRRRKEFLFQLPWLILSSAILFLILLNLPFICSQNHPDLSSSNGTITGTSEEVLAKESEIDPNNDNRTDLSGSDDKVEETEEQALMRDIPDTLCEVEGQEAAISPVVGISFGSAESGAVVEGSCGESKTSPLDCSRSHEGEPDFSGGSMETEGSQVEVSDLTTSHSLPKDDIHKVSNNDSHGVNIVPWHGIRHRRLEPSGGLYNFAADSKGAKILAANKDAKGASNILNKDKDKYLRIPCSAENKFVDMELSEEALVDSVALANYEFYSSNPKEFELLGSLVYPTEVWFFMGKFQAENIRSLQTFTLSEPKSVKYLRLHMASHYGSDFYCTLSTIEVYGIDMMEKMLEVWIAEEAETGLKKHPSSDDNAAKAFKPGVNAQSSTLSQNPELKQEEEEEEKEEEHGSQEESIINRDGKLDKLTQPILPQSGRSGLEAAMKLLMQKVRSLEHNQPLIDYSLEELNARSTEDVLRLDKELSNLDHRLGEVVMLISSLTRRVHQMEIKEQQDKDLMEANWSKQYHELNTEFDFLRFQVIKMENKEMVATMIALICVVLVSMIHILMQCLSSVNLPNSGNKFFSAFRQGLCILPFLTCIILILILSI